MSATTTNRSWFFLALLAALGCGGPSPLGSGPALVGGGAPASAELWRRDLGRAIEHPPLWSGNGWFVASTEGTLWRLAAADGKAIWRRKLPAGPAAPPVLCGDVVVMPTDAPAGEVLGMDAADGDVRWKWGRGIARAAGEDTLLILALRGGRVLRIDPRDGTKVWETRVHGGGWRDPVLRKGDGLVLVPVRRDSLVALRLEDGARAWGRAVGAWPAVGTGPGALTVVTDDGVILVLDPASGEERGRRNLDGMPAGPAVVEGGAIVVSRRDGTVLALDAGTLEPFWMRKLDPPLVTGAALLGERVFQPGDRGILHVLRLADGGPSGAYPHPEPLVADPSPHEGYLAVGGSRGTLVVYRRES